MSASRCLLIVALAMVLISSASLARLTASAVPDAVAQQLETRARAFWTAFCQEDLQALAPLTDTIVLDGLSKGFWLRRQLEKIHHQLPRGGAAVAAVPQLTFTQVTETSVLCTQAVVCSREAYQLSFTCPEMSGAICISKDNAQVIAFSGK